MTLFPTCLRDEAQLKDGHEENAADHEEGRRSRELIGAADALPDDLRHGLAEHVGPAAGKGGQ